MSYQDESLIINKKNNMVPDNTIAMIPIKDTNLSKVDTYLKPLKKSHKRDWFDKYFYKCLPLSIGNQQGFSVSIPFDLDIFWNGGKYPEDIHFNIHDNEKYFREKSDISVESHFGHGIITIGIPLILKTPPGINLMTIAAPNYINPNLFPLTGVVESDNLRIPFTLNIRVVSPNIETKIIAGQPLVSIIPIPRGFSENFEIKSAYEIFDKKIVENEIRSADEHKKIREVVQYDQCYFNGMDIFGNKFLDHRLPKK